MIKSMCCPSEAKEKDFPKFVFSKPIPEPRYVEKSWRRYTKVGDTKKKNEMSLAEKVQKANCALAVKEYVPPTDKQKYLFVNDQERVGALRTSYLVNPTITEPNTGKVLYQHGYDPKYAKMTHGMSSVYENGVAECLGEWRVMTPSKDPKDDLLDYEKLNLNSVRLDFIKEKEFAIYRKCYPIKQNRKKTTGRRDQTIFYPKDMTFGKKSGDYECLYNILTHQEQLEWLKDRKERDEKICKDIMAKLKLLRIHPDTWSNELRHVTNHHKMQPPQDKPRELTKLRRRAQPKISTFWNTDEVVEMLHDHPEVEQRSKLFSVPSASNLYYNQIHNPGLVDQCLTVESRVPFARKHSKCPQCGALSCTCASDKHPELGACGSAQKARENQMYPDQLSDDPNPSKNVKQVQFQD